MSVKSQIMLRVLINRFHPNIKESMMKCLPEEEVKGALALNITSTDVSSLLNASQERLQQIHYSWLKQPIQKVPPFLQGAVLSVLPESQSVNLKKWFPFETLKSDNISPSVRLYLLKTLLTHLDDKDVLPLSYVTSTPLTSLAQWDKAHLVELIDFLGVYDLAAEVRNIIDKDRLKKLSPCLSPKKKQFLHMCLHQPERLAPARLDLGDWDGDCKKLNSQLHHRGIARLGKALCGQSPDFVWHLAHKLDIGRGAILQGYYKTAAIPGITSVLAQQVINLMGFLQTKSTQ